MVRRNPLTNFVLAVAALLAANSAALAERTFYWSMESDAPDTAPTGSDTTPGYFSSKPMRSTAQAHGGKYALDLSGKAWKSAVFDNPTNEDVWASTNEGAMVIWWKFTGEFCSDAMLMMITGKAQKTKPELDTNDGVSIRFHGNRELDLGFGWHTADGYGTARVRYKAAEPFQADRWHRTVAKWNCEGPTTLSLQVDDEPPVTSTAKLGKPRALAWHQLLIGNDRKSAPEGLFLDDVEVWDDFKMIAAESDGASR